MDFRTVFPSLTLTASIVAFATIAGSASAQTALSNCNPVTGLGQNGQPCVELTPLDPNRINDVAPGADGSEQYQRLDTTTLGQTYACRQRDARDAAAGGRSQLLIEDCGAPISAAELGPLKPFYGTAGAPPPPPPPAFVPPPPPPPVVAVAPPPVFIPPAPVIAATPAIASAGLGNAGLLAAGLGAAALIGIAAVALGDDDDNDNSNATIGSR